MEISGLLEEAMPFLPQPEVQPEGQEEDLLQTRGEDFLTSNQNIMSVDDFSIEFPI